MAMAGRVRVVIQARVGSTRLPSKIMAPLAGSPLLAHVIGRLQAARQYDDAYAREWEVTVATTTSSSDDATERLCRELGVHCFRGSEEDVLARYIMAAADLADDDALVRATADNPVYCPVRTAAIVAEHCATQSDYVCIENLSYVVPEVMSVGALRRMAVLACNAFCHEHVTPYFRNESGEFRVVQLPPSWRGLHPEFRLTVDTAEELRRMTRIFDAAGADERLFPIERAYELYLPLYADEQPGAAPVASSGQKNEPARVGQA
jgi:spore coat polysaccharide biosynthesis protein SpsF